MTSMTTKALLTSIALAAPLSAGAAVIDVVSFGNGDTELSVFDAPVAQGALSLAVGYAGGDVDTAAGGFELRGDGDLALDGGLTQVSSPGDGTLALTFADLGGPQAAAYDGSAVVTLDFGDALGSDPLAAFEAGGSYEADIGLSGPTVGPAPIPLPASGLLLIAATMGLTTLRRRRG